MKAYKAFNADLTCRGFQYKIGKTYTIDEKPEPCVAGFHACPNLNDVFNYYHPAQKVRICEVELNGDIVKHDDKVVTNSITILKEIDYQCNQLYQRSKSHRQLWQSIATQMRF